MSTTETINRLKQYFTEIFTKNQLICEENKCLKSNFEKEEEFIFDLIETLTELELELELLGRSRQSLEKVIEKFVLKFGSNIIYKNNSIIFIQLKNILIQIYKNQLKYFQKNRNKISINDNNSDNEDNGTGVEQDISSGCDNSRQLIVESIAEKSNDYSIENLYSNEGSVESQIKFSDEISFDEFDVQSINDILMAKGFEYSINSHLSVVEEVEEELEKAEELQEEEGEEVDSIGSYSSTDISVFEKEIINKNEVINDKSVEIQNKSINYSIESIVEEVLSEILDKIESNFNLEENIINKLEEKLEKINLKECNISEENIENVMNESQVFNRFENFVKNKVNIRRKDSLVEKQPNIDSDFVSEDISSSPETVLSIDCEKFNETIDFQNVSQYLFQYLKLNSGGRGEYFGYSTPPHL